MSRPNWLEELAGTLQRRRFLGVAELEEALPEELDLADLERVFDLLEELAVILVHEARRRPVGYYPAWGEISWEVVASELRGEAKLLVGGHQLGHEDPVAAAHARLQGLEPDAPAPPEEPEDEDEPLEDAADAYLRRAQETERLDPEEEELLVARAVAGDEEAREALLESYLGRVVYLTRRYHRAGARRDDLVQAGNLGLVEALASYRVGGARGFSSHADRAIRRAIGRYLAEERRTIRLPRSVDKGIRRLLAEHERICKTESRIPDHQELAASLGVDEEEVSYLMSYLQAPLSLDAPVAPGDALRLEETLEDGQAASPSEWGARVGALERLAELLADLTVSHQRVVALRYGLLDGVARSRREVCAKTGFELAEVQQLEEEALGRLRRARDLESML